LRRSSSSLARNSAGSMGEVSGGGRSSHSRAADHRLRNDDSSTPKPPMATPTPN